MEIELEQIPNQRFTVTAGGHFWRIRLFEVRGLMCADIDRDGVRLISGTRCMPGLLIPYRYLESGNFLFETADDDYPDWRKFGDTQRLTFVSEPDDVR